MMNAEVSSTPPETPRERPILFRGPMVQAILEGRKTQTRRVLAQQPIPQHHIAYTKDGAGFTPGFEVLTNYARTVERISCPYGKPGDRLWVRETWAQVIRRRVTSEEAWWPGRQEWPGVGDRTHGPSQRNGEHHVIIWRADGEMPGGFPERWSPSIHMPRWACRLVLELTEVRVERLQSITEQDAKAEGAEPTTGGYDKHRRGFMHLWMSIHGEDAWGDNPWVWALTFRRLP